MSSGFGVTKIKTDTTRPRFQNSWCNHPPPTRIGLIIVEIKDISRNLRVKGFIERDVCDVGDDVLSTSREVLILKQTENGLESQSSENGKTAVWLYRLKLQ